MKIPVKIHPIFWVTAFIIGWLSSQSVQGALIWVGIITVSVLIHEYGHAVSALYFGQKARIELVALGGATYRSGKKISLGKEFLVVLSGPLAGFAFAIFLFGLNRFLPKIPGNLINGVFELGIFINFFWTIINLFPVQPLDGGKLFSIILESMFGLKGIKAALLLSALFGAALSIFLFTQQIFLGGILFLMFTFESFRSWKESAVLEEEDRNADYQKLYQDAEGAFFAERFQEAETLLNQLRTSSRHGLLFNKASALLATMYYQQGRVKESYALLKPLKKELDAMQLRLFQASAYNQRQWLEAIEAGNQSFQELPCQETALLNLFCHARLKEKEPTLGWLKTALKEGSPLLKNLLDREDFAGFRDEDLQFFTLLQKQLEV